jgi:hypothetical protein
MTAVGVARPSAQGQEISSTETAKSMDVVKPTPPITYQARKTMAARTITAGTKTDATRSTRRWMGALEPCASCTMRTIWASALSRPTLVARRRKLPDLLMVAPITSSPGPLSTGRLSPVTRLSSTADCPLSTTPSTGIFSPGRTMTTSLTSTWSMGSSISLWPVSDRRTTRAVLACKESSLRIASPAWVLARASRYLPTMIRVMITAADSK